MNLKTLLQKEKSLMMSNYFCQNVFKSPLLKMRQRASISGKGTKFNKKQKSNDYFSYGNAVVLFISTKHNLKKITSVL